MEVVCAALKACSMNPRDVGSVGRSEVCLAKDSTRRERRKCEAFLEEGIQRNPRVVEAVRLERHSPLAREAEPLVTEPTAHADDDEGVDGVCLFDALDETADERYEGSVVIRFDLEVGGIRHTEADDR